MAGTTGGATGAGGSALGGSNAAGTATGGSSSAGTEATGGKGTISGTGGSATTGGAVTAGAGQSATGGLSTGGKSGSGGSGGVSSGGASSGGASTGGSGGAGTTCLEFGAPTQVGKIDAAIVPPSGMVASRAHPGVLYVQEDTGGTARFHAIDTTGKTLGVYTLTGGKNTDWEDIAVGKGPDAGTYVYIGDYGDNSVNRTEIQVFRVPEPDVSPTQASATRAIADFALLRFTYPDAAHNAETLLIDPVTGDIVIVTKETSGNSSIFRAPSSTPADTPTVLEKVGNVMFQGTGTGLQASAGDFSPTGDRIIIRTYAAILLFPRAPGTTLAQAFAATPKTLPSPTEQQGEGLTFAADGLSWYSAGEQSPNLYQGKATCP
jgi:hypothetical protein